MKMHKYDTEGFFVCEHDDDKCECSTDVCNYVTPPEAGRWMDGAWVCDRSRIDARLEAQKAARREQIAAVTSLMDLDVVGASDAEILAAVRTLLLERQCGVLSV
jgi:hypothetical protein